MKLFSTLLILGVAGSSMWALGQGAASVKVVQHDADRGKLSDLRQIVRGDSGKWNDTPTLQHAPPMERKPAGMSLDDWADQLAEESVPVTASDDNWLIFRTRQLDDNDRVWVQTIERNGNEFTVTLKEAIWQGRYNKTFTYYEVTAVNLGKLPVGSYAVKWVVQPMTFKQLEKPPQPNRDAKDNWPADEPAGNGKPSIIGTSFSVR